MNANTSDPKELSAGLSRPHPTVTGSLGTLATAHDAFARVTALGELPFVLLTHAMGVTGAEAGAVYDTAGEMLAVSPEASATLGPVPRDLSLDTPVRRDACLYLRARMHEEAELVLALRLATIPADPAVLDEQLLLLSRFACDRAGYLLARREADVAKSQAKEAHERQMEMALNLYDLYEAAQQQAITDGLTGLATHAYFQERLADDLSESLETPSPLSLMIFDLDHFKSINDNYGHQAGDMVLKEAAAMLKESLKPTDLPARYGGEEFTIILPQTSEDEAFAVAERLRQTLADKEIPISPERSLKVTASIGLAALTPDIQTPKELIKRADAALYAAKNGGRNRVMRATGPAAEAVNAIGAPRKGSHEMFLALARALSAAIELRSPMLHGHSEAVGDLALRMGKVLGLAADKQEALMIAGMLHDVGMLALPDSVLLKTSGLDNTEWEQMKSHSQAAVTILSRFSTFAGLREAVLYHHERWDGKGYPEGLGGNAIPLGAQILALCDTYDALTRSGYAFGRSMTHAEAIAELRRCAGGQFNPELVELFAGMF
ncbi:diguanylate cyclase [bacterium]|nr:diguanylate cyclase [bacterium]